MGRVLKMVAIRLQPCSQTEKAYDIRRFIAIIRNQFLHRFKLVCPSVYFFTCVQPTSRKLFTYFNETLLTVVRIGPIFRP